MPPINLKLKLYTTKLIKNKVSRSRKPITRRNEQQEGFYTLDKNNQD